jgi:hypothetical protein
MTESYIFPLLSQVHSPACMYCRVFTTYIQAWQGRGVGEMLKIQCSKECSLYVKGKNNSNNAENKILKTAPKNRKCKTKS